MMKAIKNFMNKPVTWGDSFKWSGIILGLYAAVFGGFAIYKEVMTRKAIKEAKEDLRELNLEDII